jgi:aspartyl/asparaginyl-tRNA synthetase
MKILNDFYHNEGFIHIDPNIITINECEGGAGVFQITENDISNLESLKKNKDTRKKVVLFFGNELKVYYL